MSQIEFPSSRTTSPCVRLAGCSSRRRTAMRTRPRRFGGAGQGTVAPPPRKPRDCALCLQPLADRGPRDRKDRGGWIARIADSPEAGAALAAEQTREDLRAAMLARGMPGRQAVCLHPVANLATARREALIAELRKGRRKTHPSIRCPTGCVWGRIGVLGLAAMS